MDLSGTYLFLRLHSTLQIRLDTRLEVLDLLPLEPLQLATHQSTHIVKQEPSLVNPPLSIGDIGTELVEPILLRASLPQQLVLVGLALLQLLLSCVPGVVALLSLLEGGLHGADEPDVLVDYDAHCQDVLLGLAFVEFADADLDVGEAVEGAGEGGGELNGGEGVEGGGEVAAGFCQTFALYDDGVCGFEERLELTF